MRQNLRFGTVKLQMELLQIRVEKVLGKTFLVEKKLLL